MFAKLAGIQIQNFEFFRVSRMLIIVWTSESMLKEDVDKLSRAVRKSKKKITAIFSQTLRIP